MISKTVCKILAVSIALAIVASGIVVTASSTSDISNCTSVNISYADVLTNDQNDRLQIQSTSKPDLVIEDIYRKDDKIYYKIKNQGTADAGFSYSYLYIDGTYKVQDYVASLSSGQTRTESFSYKWTCTGSSDKIKVCADATKRVTESSGSNNCKEEKMSCKPDLVITDIWRKEDKIYYNIKNQGTAEAGYSYSYLYIDEVYKAKDYVASLSSDQTKTEFFRYSGECSGSYKVKVCADATKKVTESSGLNNCREETWSCPKPKAFHGNMTFKELGYETKTYGDDQSVTINFNSPYEESSGNLNLHLNVDDSSSKVGVTINGIVLLAPKYFDKGEDHWEKINIPTGMIAKGTNSLKISFYHSSCKLTLLEDSLVSITENEPVDATTFEDLGFDTSTYSDDQSVTIDFNTPYVETEGYVNLHINVVESGSVYVKINDIALRSSDYYFKLGEHWEKLKIPTGIIDQGTNSMKISFSHYGCQITLLEDSFFNITEGVEPVNGTTFEDLDYDSSTYSKGQKVTINFDSPYSESSGDLNLHLNVLNYGGISVKINDVVLNSPDNYRKGEHWEMIEIPTGIMDEGMNSLKITLSGSISCKITLLEDSFINITDVPVDATTFEDFGYDSSTYSDDQSVTVNFNSPYVESSGDLNLHLDVIHVGEIDIKINDRVLLSPKFFKIGEHWEKIDFPTGIMHEGNNNIKIRFSGYVSEITLLEDSKINITGTWINFAHLPPIPCVNETITFNASSSYEKITNYKWDFGDGTTDEGKMVTHSYASAGEFSVTLTVIHDDETDRINKSVPVGLSKWQYAVTIEESEKDKAKTGTLIMGFIEEKPVGGFDACIFHVANSVPEEPSDYIITLANTGIFMEKYVTKDGKSHYAKLLPINPQEGIMRGVMWGEGVGMFTNRIRIPSTDIDDIVLGIEDVIVPAGTFRCRHVKARSDESTGGITAWRYLDEWWDEEGRGLIQAKYESGAANPNLGKYSFFRDTTWEYKLTNFTDSLFPINYMA